VDVPFSAVVSSAGWRQEAHAWIRARAGEDGREVTGPIEQARVRPWSTQLVAPTDRGRLWFKANCGALSFEPAVHAALAEIAPAEVDPPVAIDADRGWMLTADRGRTLADHRDPTAGDWQAVPARAASLQRMLAEHGAELVGRGLPDCSPGTVPERYDAMAARLAALPADHPSHLGADRAAELRQGRDRVAAAAAALLDSPMPVSLQHGDLHPRNVFAVDGAMRLFDFGDAQWAHALEVLAVPYGWVTTVGGPAWEDLLPSYTAPWADLVDPGEIARLLPAAMVTHAVNRSWTWWGATAEATTDELSEWGPAPLHYLCLALEPFPPADG
jgi:hypothetical protein